MTAVVDAVDDSGYTIESGALLTVVAPGLLANDSITPPTLSPFLVVSTPPSNGTAHVFRDGGFVYQSTPGFVGTDSFVYELYAGDSDPDYATVTIEVTADYHPIFHQTNAHKVEAL